MSRRISKKAGLFFLKTVENVENLNVMWLLFFVSGTN